ncbi:hypothetical protein C6P45_001176 [Maudiozyma exigua]|uniref:Zn(2)-C6 fungal-type domain-containing protein n=1 Tax=Maudiozyma exigua TaxID=34358 RepID=A0A9P6WEI2_MAUEX|nr:hypothetical protein C6P45_001176 [Kazachstania exigua]
MSSIDNKDEDTNSTNLVRDQNNNNNNNAGFRVAQACDRCRSKKTRCDGKRPQCSQCAAVGFECKISDKLIRKSFPRGYTESLEERVRELEAENRRLVAICDLKEQQINIVTNYTTSIDPKTADYEGDTNINGSNNNNNISNVNILNNGKMVGPNNKKNLNVSATNLVLLSQQTHGIKPENDSNTGISVNQQHSNDNRNSIEPSPYLNKSIPDTNQTSSNVSPVNPLDAIDINLHKSSTQPNNHVCDTGCCDNHTFSTNNSQNRSNSQIHAHNNEISPVNENGEIIESKMHAKPVATTNLNDPTTISFEQDEAPGLTAAKALKKIKNHENSTQLATLVSLSIPRSTEEILFIPQLMAKIKQTFGFTSKQSLYTVTLLSSLKNELPRPQYIHQKKLTNSNNDEAYLAAETMNMNFMQRTNLWDINDLHHFLKEIMRLDILDEDTVIQDHSKHTSLNFYLKFDEIDELIELFFTNWSNLIPVLNKEEFFIHYIDFKNGIAEMNNDKAKIFNQNPIGTFNFKFFSTVLVAVCQMGLLIKIKENGKKDEITRNLCSYYHKLVYNIPRNPYFVFSTTSVKTLQFLSLVLYYHLNTGDILEIYSLRGKIISMSQQLRLHRCPSAVLVGSGSTMNRFEQSNRRILFWTIYYLDVFASLQLGVPRLIKDHEIECALPIGVTSENKDTNIQFQQDMDNDNDDPLNKNNQGSPSIVKLEGTVSQFSLAIIRFAKVMGNILDIIFKRNMSESITKQIALIHENALDNWRYRLPSKYQFKLDVTGSINMENFNKDQQNTMLIILYFLAKSIIYLPVLASKPIVIDNHREATIDKLDRSSSAFVSLQQAINTMLGAFNSIRSSYITLPIDLSRTLTRFSVMSAQGSLDYIKGGSLYIDNKTLLLDIIQSIESDRKLDLPGVISFHSLKLLDLTVNLYLQGTNVKPEKVEKFLQKKINYYNKLMGKPTTKNMNAPKRSAKKPSKANEDVITELDSVSNQPKESTAFTQDSTDSPIGSIAVKQEETSEIFNKRKENKGDAESTQTAFAEALQLDPVLNSNLSQANNFEVASLFTHNNNNNSNATAYNSKNNQTGCPDSDALKNNTRGIANSMNNSLSAIDKFFRIPSNGDFLTSLQQMSEDANNHNGSLQNSYNSVMPDQQAANTTQFHNTANNNSSKTGKMSSNNLSTMMMFLNNDFSFPSGNNNSFLNANNQADQGTKRDYNDANFIQDPTKAHGDYPSYNGQQSNSYNSNYDFIVDGSLGLAPLLVDDSNGTPNPIQGDSNSGNKMDNSQRRNSAQSVDNATALQMNNGITGENGLLIDVPRRYTYNGTNMAAYDSSHRSTKRRKRSNDAVNDLYLWQNGK